MKKVVTILSIILLSSQADARFLVDLPNAVVTAGTLGIVPYGDSEPGAGNWIRGLGGVATAGIYYPCCCNGCNDAQCCCRCNTCSKGRCPNN